MPKSKNKITSQSSFPAASPKVYLSVSIGYVILCAIIEFFYLAAASIFIILVALFTYLEIKSERHSGGYIGAIIIFGVIGFFVTLAAGITYAFNQNFSSQARDFFVFMYIVYVLYSLFTVFAKGMKFVVSTKRS